MSTATTGPTGYRGPQGLQGLRGLRGDPLGPTGPSFERTSNRLTIVTPTTSTIQLTVGSLGTYYNITNSATSDGLLTLSLPKVNSEYPETNELFPAPEQAGLFWVIRNNYRGVLNITLSNGTVNYGKLSNTNELYISYGQGISIMYNGSNAFVVM
jgi:hypothetical protein